jgi:cysteine desulfurase/selenocysteine lyase
MHRLDIEKIRADFPILQRKVYGKPLVYFDNGASSQKPRCVIDAMVSHWEMHNANVHRGLYALSEEATASFEKAREVVQKHINAKELNEIVFVRGATEAINLVAATFGRTVVGEGDEVIITTLEHHANIVPWQQLCEQKNAKLKVIPLLPNGEINLEEYRKAFNAKTKLAAFAHVSNTLGTINPVEEMVSIAHSHNVPVLIDGAQAVPHQQVDVQQIDCDFYVFTGHKVYGPTGIGVLYGKRKLLDAMPPYQTGGDMIRQVTFEKTEFQAAPHRFEAGTPFIEGALGLAAALQYIQQLGLDAIAEYEQELLKYATESLSAIPGLTIIGNAPHKAAIISFVMENVHPHDIGTILDREGIAIRAGHHCTMPLMKALGVPATARASMAFYNTKEEIDRLVAGLEVVRGLFK